MPCKRCNGNNFQRDENTGNSFCVRCGTLEEYDNYEAQLGGIKGPEGTYVRVGTTGRGSVLAYKDKKIFEANNLIESITERLNLGNSCEPIKSMISNITDGEFGQGEWFSILIGACCYAFVRRYGKGVLPVEEVAAAVGCDLHQLGSMLKRVVDHLELRLREIDLVGLFNKTASHSSSLGGVDSEKKERVMKQGAFLMNCSVKWFLSTGRKPMPLVVAVLAFVVQVNGVKVKIDDIAKDAQVSLTTCKIRYKELAEKLVEVAREVSLPWAKDVTVKNVVKHSSALFGLMEAKSMRKRKEEGKEDRLIRSDGLCLKELVRDCLSKEAMYSYDDGDGRQDSMSRYCDVGSQKQLPLSLCNNNPLKQCSTASKESEDGVCSETLADRSKRSSSSSSMWQKRSTFGMVSCEDWWKGKSKMSQRLSLKEAFDKDVGLDTLPPSYVKGCVAVKRRREKIEAAKLRINEIKQPSLELEHREKKRKINSEIDWEDLVIQTLVLHNVKDDEIEKGHYKTLLALHVFNS